MDGIPVNKNPCGRRMHGLMEGKLIDARLGGWLHFTGILFIFKLNKDWFIK